MKQMVYLFKMITINILLVNFCFAQRWEVIHGVQNRKDNFTDISEYYDRGYLIGGSIEDGETRIWDIKTDINGNNLWDKTIQYEGEISFITSTATNPSGEVIIAGSIYLPTLGSCPSIIKINSSEKKYGVDIIILINLILARLFGMLYFSVMVIFLLWLDLGVLSR